MNISVFLSYPKPYVDKQQVFIERLTNYLNGHGFEPFQNVPAGSSPAGKRVPSPAGRESSRRESR